MLPISPSQLDTADDSRGLSEKARQEIEERLVQIAEEGHAAIAERLAELDAEWTAGRIAKIALAVGILVGVVLAIFWNTWWLILPGVCGLMLLEHAISRECGLTRLMRQAGWRSAIEIEHERWALKAMRGDFRYLPAVHNRTDDDAIARLEGEGGLAGDPVPVERENRAAVHEMLEAIEER